MRIAHVLAGAAALVALTAAPAMADRELQPPANPSAALTSTHDVGVAASSTVHGCKLGQFCTYAHDNYTTIVDRMSSCTWHYTPDPFRTYVNNQTSGTRARFYNHDRHFLSYTRPAFAQGSTSLGGATWYIRPC